MLTLSATGSEMSDSSVITNDETPTTFKRGGNTDFGRVTYTDAIKLLEENNDKFEYKVYWGCDLQTEHERYLTEQIFKKPVFVTDYPKEIKAFYMKLNPDGKTVAAADCLVPGIGEIIGGSQREDDYDKLVKRTRAFGIMSRRLA